MHPIESDYRRMIIEEDRLREANEHLWKRDLKISATQSGLAKAWVASRLLRQGRQRPWRIVLPTRSHRHTVRLHLR